MRRCVVKDLETRIKLPHGFGDHENNGAVAIVHSVQGNLLVTVVIKIIVAYCLKYAIVHGFCNYDLTDTISNRYYI